MSHAVQTKELRPYQREAYENYCEWFDADVATAGKEALISFTVGLGKTFTAAACIRYTIPRGPILWITHRDELLDQSAQEIGEEIGELTGLTVEIEKAERHVKPGAQIVVASIASLHKRRLARLAKDIGKPALIVFDEAHHGVAKSWMAVKLAFPDTKVLNLTATPYRADVRNRLDLGRVLGQKNTSDGIRMGYLVPFRHAATIQVKLKGVTVRLGDFEVGSLAALLSQPDIAETCAEAIARHATGKRTIVFGANVAHSRLIAGLLREKGLRVEEVYSETPSDERKSFYAALKRGVIDVLVNNMILTEGFNLPEIDMVAILRPTQNAALYLQMLGRGLRTCSSTEKKECLVIDVVDAPKHRGSKEDMLLPSDEDAKKFAAIASSHYPKATIFLSWFRKEKEVAAQITSQDAQKLNSPARLFTAVFGREPTSEDNAAIEPIFNLYRRGAKMPEDDTDGYKGLLRFMRAGNIETSMNVLAISGWRYYPRLEFTSGEPSGEGGGGGGMAIRLEAIIEEDPQLRNFISDIFEQKSISEEFVKKYYQTLQVGGMTTVWIRPLNPEQEDEFLYLPTKERIYFRRPNSERFFCYESRIRMVQDATAANIIRDTPDYLSSDHWAALPMSEGQKPIVAEILGLEQADMGRVKVSRLAASCLISGKSLQKPLVAIATWVQKYLPSASPEPAPVYNHTQT